jgi:hypothetical protein
MKRSYYTLIILILILKPWFSLVSAQISLQPQNIQLCFGSSGLIITKGDSLARFRWQDSSNTGWNDIIPSTIFNGISNDTLQIISPPLTINNFRYRCIIDSNGTGIKFDTTNSVFITVFNPLTKPLIYGNQSICYNSQADTLKLTQTATGGNNLFGNQWQQSNNGSNWTNIGTLNISKIVTGNLINSMYYRITSTSNFGCGTVNSDSVYINVYAPLLSGSIGNSQNICYNSIPQTLKFQTGSNGGGNNYNYKWQSSNDSINYGDILSSNSDSLVNGSLNSTKYYRIKTISNFGCGLVISNTVRVKVYTPFTKALIQANDTICYGFKSDTIKIVTQASGGNGIYNYQWLQSSNAINWQSINGQTLTYFQSANLLSKQYYKLISTSGEGCGTDTSNTSLVYVYPKLNKPLITSNQNICYNTQADTLKRIQNASGGNEVFSYQWQQSTSGLSWTNITSATAQNYLTGNLPQSKYYRVVANSNYGCGIVASDSIFINVYPLLTSGVIGSNQNICYNSVPSNLRMINPSSGGGNNYNYQWQSSSDSISFVNLVGATNDSIINNNLTATSFYRLNTISNFGCGQVTSNIVKIKVYAPFVKASILQNDTICYDSKSNNIKVSSFPTGGNTVYTYQWLESTNSNSWQSIVGQNATQLQSGNLISSKYYKLISTSGEGCGSDTSNTVYVFVYPKLVKPIITNSQSICYKTQADTLRRVQNAVGGNGIFNYQWQQYTIGFNWQNLPLDTSANLQPGLLTQSKYYRILATSNFGCGVVYSDSIYINVFAELRSGIIGNNQNICFNSNPENIKYIIGNTGGGNIYTNQWQTSNDSLLFSNIIGENSDSLIRTNLTSTKYYRVFTTSTFGCGTDTSNIIKVKVHAPFTKAGIGNAETICWGLQADTLKVTVAATGGNQNYLYQWLKSDDDKNWVKINAQNETKYLTGILTATSYYRLISASGQGCGSDTSNSIKILVNPLPDTTDILGNNTVCRNQKDVKYQLSKDSILYSYMWHVKNADVLSGINKSTVYVDWRNIAVIDTLYLTQKNKITACSNVIKLPILIGENKAPDKTNIISKPNSNILICDDETPNLLYQWGYTIKSTNQSIEITGANLRYVTLPNTFDTNTYIYWVKTSLNYGSSESCVTQSYYSFNPIPLKINELSLNKDDIILYPNPSNGLIFIKGLKEKTDLIEAYDSKGQKINFDFDPLINSIFINENCSSGLYFIVIRFKDSIITKKINISK